MSLLHDLSTLVGAAFEAAGHDAAYGEVVVSQRPDLAQFQCNGALAAANAAGENPRALAEKVAAVVSDDPRFAEVAVAGPGFLNLTLTDEALASRVEAARGEGAIVPDTVTEPDTVVVDYAGPNVAKAMHVGHLRATIIGDSIKRILASLGHRVHGDPHFGDWGLQMGLVIAALAESHGSLPYFDPGHDDAYPDDPPVTLEDLQEIYPRAAERNRTDPEFAAAAQTATLELQQGRRGYRALWKHLYDVSMGSQRADFADLGVTFDLWMGESDVHDRVEPMIEKLGAVISESDGAQIIEVAQPDDTYEVPPLILTRSTGSYLYSTTDLATIDYRVNELGADVILYVVDNRQALHFEQVFRAARRGGIVSQGVSLEHIPFGTMNGPDGKPFKTREGGVLRLRDLIEMVTDAAASRIEDAGMAEELSAEERATIARQVGVAALKFGDLINHRKSDYVFDLDRFVSFEGKTGPYLQYATVRIRSILRKAEEAGFPSGPIMAPSGEAERSLMLRLLRLPDVIERAAELRAPNHLAEFAFDLAGDLSRFYEQCHVLTEEDIDRRCSWLSLLTITLHSLVEALDLLGIEAPERM